MAGKNLKYFASLDENGVVDNYTLVEYSHNLIEYCDCDSLKTRNKPHIGATFDETLGGFIPLKDPWMDDTWILNTEDLVWEPNPDIVYYHMDNIPHKWNPDTKEWYRYEEPAAE